MRCYLISDNRDTLLGMRLSGISGVVVNTKEDILNELDLTLNDKDIGIIIITPKIMEKVRDKIMHLKLKRKFPLIVVIPDRHGFGYDNDFITKYINESIGLRI